MSNHTKYIEAPISDLTELRGLDKVIVQVWHDEETIPSSIAGKAHCKHILNHISVCAKCNAWVGNLGAELTDIDYFNHIIYLENQVKDAEEVFFISHRPFIDTYEINPFGRTIQIKPKRRFHSQYILVDKLAGLHSVFKQKQRVQYIHHFTSTASSVLKAKVITTDVPNPVIQWMSGQYGIVNPSEEYLGCGGVNLVSNKRVYSNIPNILRD